MPESFTGKSQFQRALVIAVGDGVPMADGRHEPCSFDAGEIVVIQRRERPTIDGLEPDMALIPFAEVVLVLTEDAAP
jgi:co-chaperonin GroES (HSP10)